jgi:subtilisin family serine protease
MASPVSTRRVRVLLLVVAAVLVWLGRPASTQGPSARARLTTYRGHQVAQGEVIVKYRDARMATMMAREGAAPGQRLDLLNARGVGRVRSETLTTDQLIRRMKADPAVEYAEPNYVLYAYAPPNDPSFGSLWGLLNTGTNPVGGGGIAGADIDVSTAWATTTGSRGQVVGIIDTGIDYRHPDLAANVWSAPTSFQVTVGGQSISCAAGTHGFNAITKTCDPMDDNNHGTHVAGTIGGVGNNATGITGVNWVASMMGLKFLSASGSGYTSDAVLAIEFAIQAKARFAATGGANVRILSNSWGGGGFSQALFDAISRANTSDMLFVAAAGNSHTNNDTAPHYPSSYNVPNVISVAASDSSDRLSSFSCYGATSVHLAAPGSSILSTTRNNTYSTFNGTSMATPHVSGVAALALSACTATTAQLRATLLSSVDGVAALQGVTSTGGRLNAARALQACQYPVVTSLTLTPSVPSPQSPGTSITWTATATGGQAPQDYRWSVYDGTAWSFVTGWTTNTWTWTPTRAGTGYIVAVQVRSAWNRVAIEKTATKPFVVMPSASALTLGASVAAPQPLGSTVTFTARPTGGQAPYQYFWSVHDGTRWTAIGTWTTAATYAWRPVTANASYQVAVQVRSAWNRVSSEKTATMAFAIRPAIAGVTLTPSVAAPRAPGTTIAWTAAAAGGQAPYEYRWSVYNGTTWTIVTGWTTGSYTWTPSAANASYLVAVQARSAWNKGTPEKTVSQVFAIRPFVTALALRPGLTAPQALGTAITFTAQPSGGQAPFRYFWSVHDGTRWIPVSTWTTSATYTWRPAMANAAYQVAVQVRSAWNAGSSEKTTTVAFPIGSAAASSR